ncbi:MAG: 2Fe-2S iron-sulfur cluster binding domain-containing protein [Gammaproteobacteria bacterium]|nr:2Fe-2S iron-sulfur cluster binding domain-containing protein [Gammaproteobacteria bacterium]
MTSFSLLLWIVLGVAAQFAVFLGVTFWRHWRAYEALKDGQAEPATSLAVELVKPRAVAGEAWEGFRPFRVVRRLIEDEAQAICSFHLQPEDGRPLPPFLPGQFLTFRLQVGAPGQAQEQLIRCYSLSDAPRPDAYRVSIKRVPAPAGTSHPAGRSSIHFHEHVMEGSTVEARAPSGHFHIDDSRAPVVLVAGGIGLTPLMSMLEWCLAAQPGREVWLFQGVRNSRELAMRARLDALAEAHPNFHLRRCFSAPLPGDQPGRDYQHRGRIDLRLFRMELALKHYQFYLCGPAAMMEALVPALEDWGVPDSRIHYEAFGPASVTRRSGQAALAVDELERAGEILVTFAKSGRQLPWRSSSGSLLELAEANGIAVSSGCRAGGCGTCQTTIKNGEVRYRQEPDYDPQPGTCLLCVCLPKTNVTLEA